MSDENATTRPNQEAILAAPTFFVDGNLGMATGAGVARITLAAYKLNAEPNATVPVLHPEVTIAVPEQSLLAFAHEVIERAVQLGITLDTAA